MSRKKSHLVGDILERLKAAYSFKTDAALADFLGLKAAAISNWRARSSIDYDLIFTKCNDLNEAWMLSGEGPMRRGEPKFVRKFRYEGQLLEDVDPSATPEEIRDVYSEAYPALIGAGIEGPEVKGSQLIYTLVTKLGMKGAGRLPLIIATGADFVPIPQVTGEISADGSLISDNTAELRIAFRRDWIERRGDASRMSITRVKGDSMEPTLRYGDIVLIDHSRNFIDPNGGIYAIAFGNEILVKRIQILFPSNVLRVISDNTKYEPADIDPSGLTINGKVIWFGRELER